MLIRALSLVVAAGASLPVICAGPGQQLQSASDALTWAPPDLDEPVIVHATEAKHSFSLDPDRDYIVDIGGPESDRVDVGSGTLTISGGRNVVVIGGEVHAPGSGRSVMLRNQTGTMHFEGVRITGAGLREGFNIDQRRGGAVQIQNVIVDEVTGSRAGHHADVLQTWAGPAILRIDRLDGTTNYQGMMLQPFQFDGDTPVEWHFKRMVLRKPSGGGYTIYKAGSEDLPIRTEDVTLVHPTKDASQLIFAEDDSNDWEGVTSATRAATPTTGSPGVDYRSPGYAATAPGQAMRPDRSTPIMVVAKRRATSKKEWPNSAQRSYYALQGVAMHK